MRKMLLCTLVVFGYVNFCFGQYNINSERISVKTYDSEGPVEHFELKGVKAHSFDIPAFIKKNAHLERVLINGSMVSELKTTTIKFDSKQQGNLEADHICQDVQTKLTPFLGIRGTRRKAQKGADILGIIPNTSAELAKISVSDDIIGFDGVIINNFRELQKAVLASEIGDRVELTLENNSRQYSRSIVVGSRGIETISYKYCKEEPIAALESRDLLTDRNEVSFTTYPNPTNATSQINFTSSSKEDVIFTVRDIAGSLIHSEVFSNFKGSLNLDYNLDSQIGGTYILSLQQGEELYNRKVLLVK